MIAEMENPAAANCGAPKSDLAGALITSESIASLPPIQANPAAEREFAYRLAATVFGKPALTPPSGLPLLIFSATCGEILSRPHFPTTCRKFTFTVERKRRRRQVDADRLSASRGRRSAR
jgi:hypothetical protein